MNGMSLYKNFYNKPRGILLVFLLFLIVMIITGIDCPCKYKNARNECSRLEFYGVQYNHFIFFIFIGFMFPSYFFTWLILGILWEIFEYYLDKYPEIVFNYIGGCLSDSPKNFDHNNNHPYYYTVWKDIPKYLNPIDKYFNIQNSSKHGWHGSVAEIIPNIFGFAVGYLLNKLFIRKYR